LSIPDHVHHVRARRYWDSEAADQRVSNRLIALDIRGRHWTDAYLAAFATAGATAW
jgi:hypothetical protein